MPLRGVTGFLFFGPGWEAETVSDRVNLRTVIVQYCYRHFLDGEIAFAGQQKQFAIEAEVFNSLRWKQNLGGAPGKSFESALSIVVREPQYRPNHEIENAAANLPMQRLRSLLQFPA